MSVSLLILRLKKKLVKKIMVKPANENGIDRWEERLFVPSSFLSINCQLWSDISLPENRLILCVKILTVRELHPMNCFHFNHITSRLLDFRPKHKKGILPFMPTL